MELRNCEYCGTTYDARLRQCPLCGRTVTAQPPDKTEVPEPEQPQTQQPEKTPVRTAPGKRLRQSGDAPRRAARGYAGKRVRTASNHAEGEASSETYAIPKGMMVAICVILALAVLAGALLAFSRLGWSPLYREPTFETSAPAEAAEPEADPMLSLPVEPEPTEPEENRYRNEEDQTPTEVVEQPEQEQSVPCTSLTLSAPTVTFEDAGRFFNVTFTRKPAECTQPVVFSSSDETVATVSEQGKIVAVNAGSAVITASCGDQSAQCLVTCDFAYVGSENTDDAPELSLSSEDLTFFGKGESYQLQVIGAPEDESISFVSSDENVVTVQPDGMLRAQHGGTATITVTVGKYEPMTCIVRCNFGDTDDSAYQISNSDVTMGVKGETFQITLRDASGAKITGLLWVSSDLEVCSVDGTGVVKAEGKGTAYVSTTYNGVSYQCIVRCDF